MDVGVNSWQEFPDDLKLVEREFYQRRYRFAVLL